MKFSFAVVFSIFICQWNGVIHLVSGQEQEEKNGELNYGTEAVSLLDSVTSFRNEYNIEIDDLEAMLQTKNGDMSSSMDFDGVDLKGSLRGKATETTIEILPSSSSSTTTTLLRNEGLPTASDASSKFSIGMNDVVAAGNDVHFYFCDVFNLNLGNPLVPLQSQCNSLQAIRGTAEVNSATKFFYHDENGENGLWQSLTSYNILGDNRFADFPRMLKSYRTESSYTGNNNEFLPVNIPDDVVQSERLSYFFYYFLIMQANLKSVTNCLPEWLAELNNEINGYRLFDNYWWTEKGGEQISHGFSMIKELPNEDYDHMYVIFRGTVTSDEWTRNFNYQFVEDPLFPGQIAESWSSFYEETRPNFAEPIHQLRERHYSSGGSKRLKITVVGHSLGGSLASVAATDLARNYGFDDVELISFGAPTVGNTEYYDYVNKHVNVRMLMFLGDGFTKINEPNQVIHQHINRAYTIGDFVAQVFSCNQFPNCPNLETEGPEYSLSKDGPLYHRGPFYGFVGFHAKDMPNSAQYQHWNDLGYMGQNFGFGWGTLVQHFCSYMCFSGQDLHDNISETYCKFSGQDTYGATNFCNLGYDPNYPTFYGTPEQLRWSYESSIRPYQEAVEQNGVF